MANTGYIFPQSAESASESPYNNANGAWTTPQNIYGTGTANITDNAWDSGELSHVLKAYNFDLSAIPTGATINGVICRIVASCTAGATQNITLAQLLSTTRAKGGTNMAATPIQITPQAGVTLSIGASNNTWGNSLTESWVKDADFGVAIGVTSGTNNSDVYIDSVELDVYYTDANINATPGVGALTLTGYAPTVTKTENYLEDDFSDGNYTADPAWTVTAGTFAVNNSVANTISDNEYALVSTAAGTIYTPSTRAYGVWEFDIYYNNLGAGDRFYVPISDGTTPTNHNGYTLIINYQGNWSFRRYTGTGWSALMTYTNNEVPAIFATQTWYRVRIVRNSVTDEFVTGAVGTFALYYSTDGTTFNLLTATTGSNPVTNDVHTTSANFVYQIEDANERISNILSLDDVPTANKEVTPGVGALLLTGFAATVFATNLINVSPSTGELTLTGFAPTVSVSNNISVTPDVGALTIDGYAPDVSVTVNKNVDAGLGELLLSGYAPTVSVSDNKNITADVGAVSLTGFEPIVFATDTKNITTDFGVLTLTGYEPTVAANAGININPDVGILSLDGFVPTVSASDNKNIIADVGSLILEGFSPDVFAANPINILVDFPTESGDIFTANAEANNFTDWSTNYQLNGANSIETFAHKGVYGYKHEVYAGASQYANLRKNFAATEAYARIYFYIPTGAIADTSNQSFILLTLRSVSQTGTQIGITFSGNAPAGYRITGGGLDTTTATNFSLDTWHYAELYYKKGTGANSEHRIWVDGDLVLEKTNGTHTQDLDRIFLGISSANTTLDGYIYTDSIAINSTAIGAYTESLILTGFAPTVVAQNNIDITVDVGSITLTGYLPTVFASNHINVTPDFGSLVLTGYAPTIGAVTNIEITPSTGEILLAGYAPTVAATDNKNITLDFGVLTLTGFEPTVFASDVKNITTDTGVISLEGYAPTLSVSNHINITTDFGVISLEGFAPSVVTSNHIIISPNLGEVLLAGFSPVVSVSDNKNISPSLGELVLTGFAPIVLSGNPTQVSPNTGSITLTGYAPVIKIKFMKRSPIIKRLNAQRFTRGYYARD